MHVVVSGGTGFIGRHLVAALCERGDRVTVLTRGRDRRGENERVHFAHWDPESGEGLGGALAGQDAIVHLAGESAVGARWTTEKKQRIWGSRVKSTEVIVEALRRADSRPDVFVCASAVGYYGSRPGSESVDENAAPGSDFLAQVTMAWEAAANAASTFGVRVVHTRFGIVFGKDGGALSEMVKPFKLFVGGPIGDGTQVVSWVHVDDVAGMILRCLDDSTISGAVNVTAPSPVTNAELSKTIGEVLHRPSNVRVPAIALRLRFGEGADPLLTGQRVVPSVMTSKGYAFRFTDVRAALEQAL